MKKLVVVPEKMLQELNDLKTKNRPTLPVDPEVTKTVDLQFEMDHLLKRNDLSESDKSRMFGESLHKFKQSHSKALESSLGVNDIKPVIKPEIKPITNSNNIHDKIIESVPPSMQRKAKLLLQSLEGHSNLSWDHQGVMQINGKPIKGSNMIDLVNDIIRQRKTSSPPVGWQQFSQGLRDINIPKEYVGNKQRWLTMQKPSLYDDEEDEEEEFFDTSLPDISPKKSYKKDKKPTTHSKALRWDPY